MVLFSESWLELPAITMTMWWGLSLSFFCFVFLFWGFLHFSCAQSKISTPLRIISVISWISHTRLESLTLSPSPQGMPRRPKCDIWYYGGLNEGNIVIYYLKILKNKASASTAGKTEAVDEQTRLILLQCLQLGCRPSTEGSPSPVVYPEFIPSVAWVQNTHATTQHAGWNNLAGCLMCLPLFPGRNNKQVWLLRACFLIAQLQAVLYDIDQLCHWC